MVDISLSRNDDILAGSPLTITCDFDIDDQVDTPILVDVKWTMFDNGKTLISNDRIAISSVSQTDVNQYRSQITFTTLSSTYDSGTYRCTVNTSSDADYIYVRGTSMLEESTTIDVISE